MRKVMDSKKAAEIRRDLNLFSRKVSRPPANPPPQLKRPPSLREKLLQQAEAVGSADQLRQTLREAEEAGAMPEIVNFFVDLIRRGDEIGIQRFSFTRPPQQAQEEWLALPWEKWEENLRSWAKGGDVAAKEVMKNIDLFAQNTLLRDLLREVVIHFERPCRQISTFWGLGRYLESLLEKRFAEKVINPRWKIPERGVEVIQKGGEVHLYLPKKGVRVTLHGWPFIKEAEARAKERERSQKAKAEALDAEATPGLSPLKVSTGEEGNLSLFLGGNRRALIETKKQNSQMIARVAKVVGVYIFPLPSDWVIWSPERDYLPLRGNQWPLEEIPRALKAWENSLLQVQAKEKEQREKIASVTSIATLPIPLKEQGFTRLLRGEKGTASLFYRKFEWGKEKGLFAIAVERSEGEEFLWLRKVASDFPFPETLQEKPLPQLIVEERQDGSLRARFEKLPQMEREIFQALMMVQKIVQIRLNAEHRASQGEPAPGEENNQTG